MSNMNEQPIDDYSEFDMPNPYDQMGGGMSQIVFINSVPSYKDTALERGGFRVSGPSMRYVSGGAWQDMADDRGNPTLVAPFIECAVIGSSEFTRRMSLSDLDTQGQRYFFGHVDIDTDFWKSMDNGIQAQFNDHKEKAPVRRASLFVVLREQPDRVWELPMKSGNAGVLYDLQWQFNQLAVLQTTEIKKLSTKPLTNTMMPFINWIRLVPGCQVPYKQYDMKKEAGSFTRLSIGWPNCAAVGALQKPFIKQNDYGFFVDRSAELFEAKKRIGKPELDAMRVDGKTYGQLLKMRDDLDKKLMEGYIKPLASFEAIQAAVEEKKQQYLERASRAAIEAPQQRSQLPPAETGPRNRDEWDEAKANIAQNPPTQKKTTAPNGTPDLWTIQDMQKRKKLVVLGWADATEQDKAEIVSSVNVQYLMRVGDPFDFGDEPTAKSVAKAISTCITWDEVKADERGEVAY